MTKRYAVILAAGQGTRMKSKLYKVLHPVLGRPMVQHVIDQIKAVQLDQMVTVVSRGADRVVEHIGSDSAFVIQEEQLGTGHAVIQAEDVLKDKEGTTMVVCGDTPLISTETYQALFEHHEKEGASATILTTKTKEPSGYGRVIRSETNEVERIVEHKDANANERLVEEINTGTYCFDNQALFSALKEISNDNVQGEYYLPDVIEVLRGRQEKVSAFITPDFEETLGINDRLSLAQAEKIMKHRINAKHMRNGVAIIDPDHTYIHPDVVIKPDAVIHPGTILTGATTIESDAEIGPHSEVNNCYVGSDSVIKQSVTANSKIGERVKIGPYAHIRPESAIENDAKVGNFVEIKKATIGTGSKVSHLSYMGDAQIGNNVNVGCGTITVNYDGKHKYLTTIEDDSFIGCNSNLIAPVTIGADSYVAAGSTITKDVPAASLSVARARQTNKEGYATKLKNRQND
ncbi:bifunctional UDP-N-acetylglucosamine diphosphorylase/glucosamine-1-phosphate N-acetyltransferase GlmU [Virgibacillus sp. NKC19-3]|uniref:bifunctional UDP-N-acetylglucosamine diphosphorylase/glucosamine-1-phosphate N-acetyltransferase GlmU n=1 Tax=Virgibacillus saliphilus TaxID=2831674 RepID=UPI001C9A349E|nr:bifunctional UDP-N-acetylglucosamine diphosphorylase/glucosamine-1-phosphate N-acetyltransferase GlmU [Virgibacillus sp. NKC19-3]MBY7141606.1 bifunctional UDP-N-acetylglucosamine diphosphorylase/glucosamine-1-phosphate N-acetyltransferase GlmU [Virgibacillus sp. NKC19-3]